RRRVTEESRIAQPRKILARPERHPPDRRAIGRVTDQTGRTLAVHLTFELGPVPGRPRLAPFRAWSPPVLAPAAVACALRPEERQQVGPAIGGRRQDVGDRARRARAFRRTFHPFKRQPSSEKIPQPQSIAGRPPRIVCRRRTPARDRLLSTDPTGDAVTLSCRQVPRAVARHARPRWLPEGTTSLSLRDRPGDRAVRGARSAGCRHGVQTARSRPP